MPVNPNPVENIRVSLDEIFSDYPALMTLEEVAQALRIGHLTAARWRREGRLPACRLPGTKNWLIVRDELARALMAGRLTSQQAEEDR